jgi:uncharacterized protein involved in copper resistance
LKFDTSFDLNPSEIFQMKTIISAIALTIAIPAYAQTAPAADPHAQHKGMDHSKDSESKHDCKACCEKMKQSGGKMECMDKKGEAKPAAPASGHEGHTQ